MTSEYDLRYPPGKPRPNVRSLGLLARKYAAEGIPPVPPYLDIEDSEDFEPHEVAQKQQSPGDQTGDSTTERQNMNSIDDTSWAGLGPNYEMSAWMRGQVAKVMDDATRQLRARPERLSSVGTVVAPLGMKVHPPGSRADRECDRCGVYVPEGDDLVLISLPFRPRNPRHPWLRVFGGLCEACAAKESGPKRTVAGGAR